VTGFVDHCVPLVQDRSGDPGASPVPDEWLAWRYLLPESRLRRCVERVEVYSVRLGRRFLDVDLTIPYSDAHHGPWMVPVAFLDKDPIAPDLQVHDANGDVIATPTLAENMAITFAAIRLIAAELDVELDGVLPELIARIIREDPDDAQLARFVVEEEVSGDAEHLVELLYHLDSQFLLWVRVDGDQGADRHVSIARRAPRGLKPVLRPDTEWTGVAYPVGDGYADFLVPTAGKRLRPDFGQLSERLALTLGLRAIEIESDLTDTARFASFHHCVQAPRGFVVREVRVSCPLEDEGVAETDLEGVEVYYEDVEQHDDPPVALLEREPELRAAARATLGGDVASEVAEAEEDVYEELPLLELEEIEPGPGLLVQGHDSEIAHVHCSREENVSPLVVNTTLATSSHLTSLWALVVVLSAALLWLFDRRSPYPPLTDPNGHLQIAAGALLLVPTFAAAWVIRSDETAATRLVLSGTRLLLLLCGVLSVCAALTLDGVLPRHFGEIVNLKLYASLAYFAATIVAVSWVLSLRTTWYAYRHWLRSPARHLRATLALVVLAIALTALAPLSPAGRYLCAALLLIVGFCLAAVSANRIGTGLSESRGRTPLLASLAAVVVFLGAGYWLRFYDEVLASSSVQLLTVIPLALLGAGSCRGLELRSQGARPTAANPQGLGSDGRGEGGDDDGGQDE
jgi:hypothetical protein